MNTYIQYQTQIEALTNYATNLKHENDILRRHVMALEQQRDNAKQDRYIEANEHRSTISRLCSHLSTMESRTISLENKIHSLRQFINSNADPLLLTKD